MNCKPGDLAIVVVPSDWWGKRTLDGKIVEVVHFVPPRGDGPEWDQRPTWWCKHQSAWFNDHGVMFTEGMMLDSWLRRISGVPITDDVKDEVPA